MENIKLSITKTAAMKLRYFIEECDAEISGFGKVREVNDESGVAGFQLYDVEILPQTVSGVDATISDEALAEFLNKKMRAKKSTEPYKLWWHSHVNMDVFFSTTDTDTIDGSTEFPYLISLVGNKKNEYLARFDCFSPFRFTFDVDVMFETDEDEELRDKIRKDIEKNVTFNMVPNGQERAEQWVDRNVHNGDSDDDDDIVNEDDVPVHRKPLGFFRT